jgi:Cu/Ag efflux pump CusA
MHWLTKPGTSHPEMYRITVQSSKELRAIPGVRNFGAHIGRALVADEPVGMNFTENWVSVDPKADYDSTFNAIQETVDGYPGIYRDVQTYLKERIREVLTGGGLHVQLQGMIPHVQVKVDLAAAERYGIKPGDVLRYSNQMMTGHEVSDIHQDGWVYDVQVWSIPEARQNLTNLREMLIDTPRGGYVALQDVANVTVEPTPNMIQREDGQRRIDVQANVRGRALGDVVADVETRLAGVQLPLGYRAELMGEWAERQSAQSGRNGNRPRGASCYWRSSR